MTLVLFNILLILVFRVPASQTATAGPSDHLFKLIQSGRQVLLQTKHANLMHKQQQCEFQQQYTIYNL